MAQQKNHKWSDEDIQWLKENYAREKLEVLIERMKTPVENIRSIANYYGLRRDTKWLKAQRRKVRDVTKKTKQIVKDADIIPRDAIVKRIHSGVLTIMGNVLIHRGI